MSDFLNLLRGYLMGAADVVPGVSGGTVALVLGIYERLIASIRHGAGVLGAVGRGRFATARAQLAAVEWRFILVLVAGIVLAVLSLAQVIEHYLEEEPQATSGLFFGLVAGSITIAWRRVGAWTAGRAAAAAATALAAFVVLGFRSEEVTDPTLAVFFGAGAVAIVAMILPGISGSFILLMLGMYEVVLAAVNDRDGTTVLVFLIGAVTGLAVFSTILHRLLRNHHDVVMAVLVGLMAGSLRVLWPWPDGTETAQLGPPQDLAVPVLMAVMGVGAVLIIEAISHRLPAHADEERSRSK